MPNGYTLIEIVVAIFVFCVGGLALTGTSAVVGRQLRANAVREQGARVDANRRELLLSRCASGRLRC